jgi:hypothetical protein
VFKIIQDDQVSFYQRLGDLLGLFLLRRIDLFNRREEAHAFSVMQSYLRQAAPLTCGASC